jgi:small subunit ribosomal protein S20
MIPRREQCPRHRRGLSAGWGSDKLLRRLTTYNLEGFPRVANIKSQIKRNKQNEKARQRNKAVKSSLRTSVRKFREAADGGNTEAAETALRAACRQLDKAASKGVIHKNQAANRKSAIARRYAELQQG